MSIYRLITILTSLILLSACTTAINPALTDKGILQLSNDNPYLGSNLFLGKEMEQSGYLFKFMQTRGGPKAMRLEQDFWGNFNLTLFYPEEREIYQAERDGKKLTTDWIIKGPFPINRHDYRELRQSLKRAEGSPIFVVYGNSFRFNRGAEWQHPKAAQTQFTRVEPEFEIPTPIPTPKPKKKKTAVVIEAKGDPKEKPVASIPPIPLNADQMAIALSQGFAERAPNGDLVHSVRFDGETVKALASWYAGDKSKEGEIRELNKLTEGASLKKGDRITIPLKIVKNFRIMSSDFYVE